MTPLFWLLELLQNQAYRLVRGEYGWTYSASPYGWFSFSSMILWAGGIALIWTLDRFVFIPRGTPPWRRLLLLALATFAGEWLGGFLGDLLHHPMQRWTNSPLVYVSPVAYGFWIMNVLCYDLLRRWLAAPLALDLARAAPASAHRYAEERGIPPADTPRPRRRARPLRTLVRS